MTVTAWRIVRASFAATAFEGEGARRFGGRWNSKGTRVVYTAGSRALAILELLVHLNSEDLMRHYRLIPVTFLPAQVEKVEIRMLPLSWRRGALSPSLRAIGDKWANGERSVVLEVPSVIVPDESNYLINPQHPQFKNLRIGKPEPFRFDRRLK